MRKVSICHLRPAQSDIFAILNRLKIRNVIRVYLACNTYVRCVFTVVIAVVNSLNPEVVGAVFGNLIFRFFRII